MISKYEICISMFKLYDMLVVYACVWKCDDPC